MSKYQYLKKYKGPFNHVIKKWCENSFFPVTKEDIITAELRLGFEFPYSLKEFWLEIGCGNLTTPPNPPKDYECGPNNDIFHPEEIADILLLKEESNYILPEAVEYIDEGYVDVKNGDIIFFDIGDSSDFLVMKPKSKHPNGIYTLFGNLIEEEFEQFIWKLYYESPGYYLGPEEEYEEKIEVPEPERGALWHYISCSYNNWLGDKGLRTDFYKSGEIEAQEIYRKFKDEIKINKCSNCGHMKKTPKAKLCLNCGLTLSPMYTEY